MLGSLGRGLRHDLGRRRHLAEQRTDQGRSPYRRGPAVCEFDTDVAAANQRLARSRSLDRAPAPERQANPFAEIVRSEHDECGSTAVVAVCDAVGTRRRLVEARVSQHTVYLGAPRRIVR